MSENRIKFHQQLQMTKSKTQSDPSNITTNDIAVGKSHVISEGSKALIISYGVTVNTIYKALEKMNATNSFTFINLLCINPLDEATLIKHLNRHKKAIVIEEATEHGSIGSAILELINKNDISIKLEIAALPNVFLETASRQQLLSKYGLDEEGIISTLSKY